MLGLRAGRRKFAYDDVPSPCATWHATAWRAPSRLSQLGIDRRTIRHVLDQGVADRRYVSATGVRLCCGTHQQSMVMPSKPAMDGSDSQRSTFRDAGWVIRWLVVDTGHWLLAGKFFCRFRPWATRSGAAPLPHQTDHATSQGQPGCRHGSAVSRQIEAQVHDYFGWDPYWSGSFLPMSNAMATPFVAPLYEPQSTLHDLAGADAQPNEGDRISAALQLSPVPYSRQRRGDRSCRGFLVDDAGWSIRYIKVDTRNWWPGESVLISPYSVREIDWPGRLSTSMSAVSRSKTLRRTIRQSPSMEPTKKNS